MEFILNVYALVASCSERGNTDFLVIDVARSWFEGVFLLARFGLFVNRKCHIRVISDLETLNFYN